MNFEQTYRKFLLMMIICFKNESRLVVLDICRGVESNLKCSYIGVLVSCNSDELCLCEGESLDSSWLAGVLCPILVYFHHMEPGLVLVEGLENHHLEIQLKTRVTNSASNFRWRIKADSLLNSFSSILSSFVAAVALKMMQPVRQ